MNPDGKILIAEDDKFLSKILQTKLTKVGYSLILANDGQEAIDLARSEKPVLVLLDLIMPNKNGFEVLEEAKADPELSQIPIVILSNLGQDEDIKRGMDLGAKDYIVKANISIDKVVEKIDEYLK